MKIDTTARMQSEIRLERRPLPRPFNLSNRLEDKQPQGGQSQPVLNPMLSHRQLDTPLHSPVKPEVIPIDDPVIKPPREGEAVRLNEVV